MGVSKADVFSQEDNLLARYAKALAHPARIAILRVLVKRQACICGDIVDELPLAQSTISQHLRELKAAGLIKGEVEGARVCYCIDEEAWATATAVLGQFMEHAVVPDNTCC